MKKSVKIALIVAGSLLAAGIIICTVGFIAIDFDFTKLETVQYEKKEYTAEVNGISEISLDVRNNTIKVIPTNSDTIKITYYENEKEHYLFSDPGSDGAEILKMSYTDDRNWYDHIGIYFSWQNTGIVVEVPKEFDGVMTLITSNATVDLNNMTLPGPVQINTSNGTVKLTHVNLSESLQIKTSNGRIVMKDVVAGSMICETSNDTIKIDAIQSDSIKLKTKNGDVTGTITGSRNNYRISSSTSNGKNNLENLNSSGEKELSVRTSNDDIHILFSED